MSVITFENCEWWLKILKSSSKRDIEKAVANARGHRDKDDSVSPPGIPRMSEKTVKLQLEGDLAMQFARVRAVGEITCLRPLTDVEMLVELMECYLRHQTTDHRR